MFLLDGFLRSHDFARSQNLKISTRLMLGFGLMALLILVMSGTTTFFTNRADEQFHVVTEDRLPKVINLHVLKGGW